MRTILCVIGISASLVSTIVMALLTDYYSNKSTTFFTPFQEYDQVLERGTNFVQVVPIGSSIDKNVTLAIEPHFGVEGIPMLIVPNNDDLLSFYNTYIFGIPQDKLPDLLSEIDLQQGEWPDTSNEVVVGSEYANMTSMEILNHTYTVVGVLNVQFSYLDRLIILDHVELESISGKIGRTTVIFIPKVIEEDLESISSFEDAYPNIDIMTNQEFDDLRGQIGGFMDNLVNVLSVFTSASAIIFVFSLELLNIFSRKKDFEVLQILGATQVSIFGIVVLESIFLLLFGILIGIPASFIIYSVLFSILLMTVNPEALFFPTLSNTVRQLTKHFPFDLFGRYTLIITIANILFAFVIALVGLHKFQISNLKQKY